MDDVTDSFAYMKSTEYFCRVLGQKQYELTNHLGNVLATVLDRRTGVFDEGADTLMYYVADVVSATLYYPFGSSMMSYSNAEFSYAYGFGNHQKIDEVSGAGNTVDMGDRWLDVRLGRTPKMDAKADLYPGISPYAYALNTPIWAYDPDGKLVIFVNGLRPSKGAADQMPIMGGGGIYNKNNAGALRDYWRTDKNAFGRKADIAGMFMSRLKDDNAYFTSGSSTFDSQAKANWLERNILGVRSRYHEGISKADKFHKMVQKGKITLADGETIKIVTHSQGGAHGEGMATRLIELGYTVEVIYNVTPHQPTDMSNPNGVRGVQYSHPGDAVSSQQNWLQFFNGGSTYGPIQNITEFRGEDIMGGEGQPNCEGPTGNRCGHNVTDNDYIFDIPAGQNGYVAPRKDNPSP